MKKMITLRKVKEVCSHFQHKKILVYGDIILDRYIFGQVNRISPEAPVPVLKIEKEEFRLGGAGNVAANINSLGAATVLMGIIGNDIFAQEFTKLLTKDKYIIRSSLNKTLVKTRVISQRQQIVRIDREEKITLTPEMEKNILKSISSESIDAIIVSDYAKGSVTKGIMEGLSSKAKAANILLVVDPKPLNFSLYKNIDGITPNLKEAQLLTHKKIITNSQASDAVKSIRRKFGTKFSLITRGDKGITAIEKGKKPFHLPALSHEVFDVTGAGDTVISVLVLSLISGATLKEAVNLANVAASMVVERIGTSQVAAEEIQNRIKLFSKHLKQDS
jgi:rfaE bifunctional protein kinase chain/domain